jgi:hypothetical protein
MYPLSPEQQRELESDMFPASVSESISQWARVCGHECKDRAWLLHDRDVWVPNPSYDGPPQPHPEEEHDIFMAEEYRKAQLIEPLSSELWPEHDDNGDTPQ